MKKIVVGVGMILSSIIGIVGVLIAAAVASLPLTSWFAQAGKIWTSVSENGLVVFIVLFIILFFVGAAFIVWELMAPEKKIEIQSQVEKKQTEQKEDTDKNTGGNQSNSNNTNKNKKNNKNRKKK